METVEKKVATKVKILQEACVRCEPHWGVTRYCRDEEARAKALESWCKEFNDFIRDHRHQDGTQLYVERDVRECCSACKAEWETYQEEGKTMCASCGTEVA